MALRLSLRHNPLVNSVAVCAESLAALLGWALRRSEARRSFSRMIEPFA